MEAFDAFVPHFRLAKERWPEAPTLTKAYSAVLESYEGSSHDIIGSCKSFIECVCRTILGDCGKPDPPSDSNPTFLLRESLKALGLQKSRGASKLDDVLTAHNMMSDALLFMRNKYDPGAHGKDGFLDTLSTNECRAYLVTADTILALLLAAYDGREPDLLATREPYERFERFHRLIDQNVTMGASLDDETGQLMVTLQTPALPDGIELILAPSELLYALDRTAYVELLRSAAGPAPSVEAESTAPPIVSAQFMTAAPVTPQIVPEYNGSLSPLKVPLQEYLHAQGGLEGIWASTQLCDSILATAQGSMGLDWTSRAPLLAAMKVSLRRTLVRFGIEAKRAEQTAEGLVAWLKTHAATLTETAIA
jgi:Abortive infection C-terminus